MIQIIKATPKHAHIIAKIGKQTFLESHGNSASIEDIKRFILKTYNTKTIHKEFENPNVQYHLIYFKNEIAGFSKIELNTSNNDITDLNITKLDRIYLLKKYYEQKLGSKLFDFIIQLSKKQHQKGIWLAVWIENQRALSFYTKKRFKIVGEFSFKISETHANPNHIMYLKY